MDDRRHHLSIYWHVLDTLIMSSLSALPKGLYCVCPVCLLICESLWFCVHKPAKLEDILAISFGSPPHALPDACPFVGPWLPSEGIAEEIQLRGSSCSRCELLSLLNSTWNQTFCLAYPRKMTDILHGWYRYLWYYFQGHGSPAL